MQIKVVTEGPSDANILKSLLNGEGDRVTFYTAQGLSAVDSLARSLLASGSDNVAVVVDTDSRDPIAVEERRQFFTRSLKEVAPRARTQVVVFEPTIEALFFEDRDVLEHLVEKKVSDTDFATGRYEPKRVLGKYLTSPLNTAIAKLTASDLKTLRDFPAMKSLLDFVAVPG